MATLKTLSTELYGEASAQAVQTLLEKSPVFRFFETVGGWELGGTDFDWRPAAAAATVAAVAEGGSFNTPTALSVDSKVTDAQSFYYAGFKISQSRILDAKKKLSEMDLWLNKKRQTFHRSFAAGMEKEIFLGAGTSNAMKGFKTILDGSTPLPGYTDTSIYTESMDRLRVLNAQGYAADATDPSLDLSSSTNHDGFIEMLYDAIALMDDPKGIVIPNYLRPRFTTILRKTNLLTTSQNYERVVDYFAGIPLVYVPDAVIAHTEPDDTAGTALTNTTSIYLLSPEEQRCSLVSNVGMWYYTYDHVENEYKDTERMGMNLRLKVEDNRSVLRVRNIKVK